MFCLIFQREDNALLLAGVGVGEVGAGVAATALGPPEGGLEQLHTLGFRTVALALTPDAHSIEDPGLHQADKLALLLGTEGDGLARTTIDGCFDAVCIPMSHDVDSLNVAAASAVAFWELRYRQPPLSDM